MKTYPIPMVPGPVRVPASVLAAYQTDFGSGDLEREFLDLYNETEADLQAILGTKNRVAIQSGEGMLALWGALKSCIRPGERVLALASGMFGYGIGEMAAQIGAEVKIVGVPYDRSMNEWEIIEKAIIEFQPKMITVVHCETPSGTFNPIAEIGKLKEKHGVPLLYVDAVASAGGAPVNIDDCRIDLGLGGTQKVLSTPPGMAFVSVSEPAWKIIDAVNYVGYDALKPFRTAQHDFAFPYTPYWHGLAALHTATQLLLDEGLQNSFARHKQAAAYCRRRIVDMGLELFPQPDALPATTVTAVKVPEGIRWAELDARLRREGLVVGGNYGPLAEKVFRLGHMGTQADMELLKLALDVLEKVVKTF